MTRRDYFETASGTGVLATADAGGKVDAAIYSTSHVLDDGTVAFIRMWEYYLCYCEGAFRERYIGNVQMVLAKPGSRPTGILPTLTG